MQAEFLQAAEGDIERRVKERPESLENDIRNRMPTLVHESLLEVFSSSEWPPEVAKVVDSRARHITNGMLGTKDKWPDWFKNCYLNDVNALVNQHLNAEFETRVQAEAEKRLELM